MQKEYANVHEKYANIAYLTYATSSELIREIIY